MRYKLLGRSGLRVSELCLGTMTFGEDWGWGASRDECARIVDAFAEAGGNFIDTAHVYTNGSSEQIVGELIAADQDFWLGRELRATIGWHPDIATLRNGPTRIIVGIGEQSGGQLCERTSTVLAAALETEPRADPIGDQR